MVAVGILINTAPGKVKSVLDAVRKVKIDGVAKTEILVAAKI